jgi:uncharacterized membrane protein
MIRTAAFEYEPMESEAEKASNGYLMSVIAIMAGLPIPIINLIASLLFYFGNRRSTWFVRWHCTQALLAQAALLPLNSVGFWWTISILTDEAVFLSNQYVAYIITLLLFNMTEFILTIISAIKVRKGQHVKWWLYGPLTDIICRRR